MRDMLKRVGRRDAKVRKYQELERSVVIGQEIAYVKLAAIRLIHIDMQESVIPNVKVKKLIFTLM